MKILDLYASIRHDKDKVHLLRYLFNLSSTDLLLSERVLTSDEYNSWQDYSKRYDSGEPISYLIGTAPFGPYDYKVTPDVLIPRDCTWMLVELITRSKLEHAVVLDVGTGSGCIAASIKKLKPLWTVIGIDICPRALAVAAENGVEKLIQANFISAIKDHSIDIIVSNPPYIQFGDNRVDKNVHQYEPHKALYIGDGLDAYRHLAEHSSRVLKADGILAMECGQGQAQSISNMLASAAEVIVHEDNNFIERIVTAKY